MCDPKGAGGASNVSWKAAVVDKGIWRGQTSQSQKYICSNGKFDQDVRNKIAPKLFLNLKS